MERAMRNPMEAARAAVPRRLAILLLASAIVLFAADPSLAAPATAARFAPPTEGPLLQDPEFPESPDDGSGEEDPEEEPEDEEEPGTEPPTMKPPPTVPDSLRKIPAATLPVGGAPVETLVVRPGNVLGRPDVTAAQAPPPKVSRTPFGLHPAAIFAVLVVGHVFLVRAVTD